jgi:hypothetical protein
MLLHLLETALGPAFLTRHDVVHVWQRHRLAAQRFWVCWNVDVDGISVGSGYGVFTRRQASKFAAEHEGAWVEEMV